VRLINKNISINKYSAICSELKLLYTAITRARNKVIFFDS